MSKHHYVMRDQVRNLVPELMGTSERKPLRHRPAASLVFLLGLVTLHLAAFLQLA